MEQKEKGTYTVADGGVYMITHSDQTILYCINDGRMGHIPITLP